MAQKLVTAFVNTNIPGAYVNTTVKSTNVGVSSNGDIVIIGEAEGGADYTTEVLKDNFFDATQLDRVKAKYLRGPIVDAMAALVSPADDADIQGSAGNVYIVKTNGGVKASAIVAGDAATYGTMSDKNFGVDGNKYFYQITQSEAEAGPSLQGTDLVIGDGSIFDGLSFTLRGSGGVATVVTLSATMADHDTKEELAAEIDAQLPAGFSCIEAATDAVIIYSDADSGANEDGHGKAFELIDSTPGDLAALGLAAGLTVSSQEPEILLEIKRQDTNTNESYLIEAEVALSIGYVGTSASLDISSGVLTTTVVGGAGSNLSITLSEYTTMTDLAAYISSQTGYSATSIASSNNLSPVRLDEVASVAIASSGAVEPGRIKKSAWNFASKIAESSVIDFAFALSKGLPIATTGSVFLASGAKGATTAADIVNAIPALEGIKVSFVVPLFSQDATADIAAGLTDSSSTYTVDAANFAIKSHALAMSTVKLKRNRIAMLSKWDTYANAKAHAQALSSFRATMCFQKTSKTNSEGVIEDFFPWHTAVVAAGMQSAGFNESITAKKANVISHIDPSGFDSGNQGDVSDAIDAGMMFLQAETAGSFWVVDQTSYGFDQSFVYNSMQAVYMSDVLAISLGESLQKFIVGKSTADITAASIAGRIAQLMDDYRKLKIIGPSDDAPLGYKNLKIKVNAPVAEINIEAKLATAYLFVPVELELSQIQSSASA